MSMAASPLDRMDPASSSIPGKRQWLLWAAIMAGVLAALFVTQVILGWTDGILFVIGALFVGCLAKNFRDISYLDRETRRASEQVRQLRETNDIEQFIRVAEPSIFRHHIESLHTIFLRSPRIEQDTLIEVAHARLIARNRIVELMANILITLGLIGTIVGLIAAVGGLGTVLEGAGEKEKLIAGMQTTVDGLGTAFYTTLLGSIFGGVILRVLANIVDANIVGYMAHLAELTEVYVLPAMRRMAGKLQGQGYYEGGR